MQNNSNNNNRIYLYLILEGHCRTGMVLTRQRCHMLRPATTTHSKTVTEKTLIDMCKPNKFRISLVFTTVLENYLTVFTLSENLCIQLFNKLNSVLHPTKMYMCVFT